MKPFTLKKHFAFIITALMFLLAAGSANSQSIAIDSNTTQSNLTESANSQRCDPANPCPPGHFCFKGHCQPIPFCKCGYRNYGCTTPGCVAYCSPRCGLLAPANETSLHIIYHAALESASISFSIPQPSKATLKVFDSKGILLRTLIDNTVDEGEHVIELSTLELNVGVYFIHLQSATVSQIEKLIISK